MKAIIDTQTCARVVAALAGLTPGSRADITLRVPLGLFTAVLAELPAPELVEGVDPLTQEIKIQVVPDPELHGDGGLLEVGAR